MTHLIARGRVSLTARYVALRLRYIAPLREPRLTGRPQASSALPLLLRVPGSNCNDRWTGRGGLPDGRQGRVNYSGSWQVGHECPYRVRVGPLAQIPGASGNGAKVVLPGSNV